MKCPDCKIHWVGFIGGGTSTIDLGRCRNCGATYVVDLVQLVKEAQPANKEKE